MSFRKFLKYNFIDDKFHLQVMLKVSDARSTAEPGIA